MSNELHKTTPAPTPEQLRILREFRQREARCLMGKGDLSKGPPEWPDEICDPATGELYPWAKVKP